MVNDFEFYVVTDETNQELQPFVTTWDGYEKFCKEKGLRYNYNSLTPVFLYPGWYRLPAFDIEKSIWNMSTAIFVQRSHFLRQRVH